MRIHAKKIINEAASYHTLAVIKRVSDFIYRQKSFHLHFQPAPHCVVLGIKHSVCLWVTGMAYDLFSMYSVIA